MTNNSIVVPANTIRIIVPGENNNDPITDVDLIVSLIRKSDSNNVTLSEIKYLFDNLKVETISEFEVAISSFLMGKKLSHEDK